jgi:hypothetical protein
MSINAINPTTPGINYENALTPDALMAYCANRLRDLDEQMQQAFAGQQKFRVVSEALGEIQQTLQGASSGKGLHADDGSGPYIIKCDYEKALANMPDGPEKDKVQASYQEFMSHCSWQADPNNPQNPGGQKLVYSGGPLAGESDGAAQACRDAADHIGQINKDLSSSSELAMISLQSLMSQRQTAIQICTNLVSALGETSKAIAQKIGT